MRKKPKSSSKDTTRDQCQTPPYALDPILKLLSPHWKIWEPARGKGFIVSVLKLYQFEVVSGDILTGQDFFNDDNIPEKWDCIVTNPPFSIKYDWFERCCKLDKPFALIMPIDVLGAASGQYLAKTYNIEVILMSQRIDYFMPNVGYNGKGSQFNSAWFTYKMGLGRQLTFVDIPKPKRSKIDAW